MTTISEPRAVWGRRLALTTAVVFVISSAFPVAAGLSHNTDSFPEWWGAADVGVAFFLAILAVVIHGLAQGRVDRQAEDLTYRTYRFLTWGLFAMIVAFLLLGIASFGPIVCPASPGEPGCFCIACLRGSLH